MEDFEAFVEEVKANVKTIGLDFDHDQEGSILCFRKTMQAFCWKAHEKMFLICL